MYEKEIRDWLKSSFTGTRDIDNIEITPELKKRYLRHLQSPVDENTELTRTEKLAQSVPVKALGDIGAGTMEGLAGAVRGVDWLGGALGGRPQLPKEIEQARTDSLGKNVSDLLAEQSQKSSEMGFEEGSIPKYLFKGLGHAAVSIPLMAGTGPTGAFGSAPIAGAGIVPYSIATAGGEAKAAGMSGLGQLKEAGIGGVIGFVQDKIFHLIGEKNLSMIPRQFLAGGAMAGVPIVANTVRKIAEGEDPTKIDWERVAADFVQGALFPIGGKGKKQSELPKDEPIPRTPGLTEESFNANLERSLRENLNRPKVEPKIEITTAKQLKEELPGSQKEQDALRSNSIEEGNRGEGWSLDTRTGTVTAVGPKGDFPTGTGIVNKRKNLETGKYDTDPSSDMTAVIRVGEKNILNKVIEAKKQSLETEDTVPKYTIGEPEAKRPTPTAAEAMAKSETPLPEQPIGTKVRQTVENSLAKELGFRVDEYVGKEKFHYPEETASWLDKAAMRIKSEGTESSLNRLLNEKNYDKTDIAEGRLLLHELHSQGRDVDITNLAQKLANVGTEKGRELVAFKTFDILTSPEFVAAKIFREAKNKLGDRAPKLTPEVTKILRGMAEKASAMPEGRDRDIAVAQIYSAIRNQVPKTIWKKISTIQAINQLLNAKTVMRNVIGNTGLEAMELISHYVGVPIDKLMSRFTDRRGVVSPKIVQHLKNIGIGMKTSVADIRDGINTSKSNIERLTGMKIKGELENAFQFSAGETFREHTFWGRLEKLVGYTLQAPDRAFFEGRFWDSVDNMLRAGNVKKITPEIMEQALQEASRVTFRDSNNISNALVSVKKGLNKLGSNVMKGEFGLGDLALKYPKVPGAILKRGIEYSPFGLITSLLKPIKLAYSGIKGNDVSSIEQRRAVLSMARGVVGTALSAIGYALAKDDRVTGQRTTNPKIAAFEDAIGKRPYSVKTKKGFISYDWLQPAAIPFTMGVDIATKKELEKKGDSIFSQIVNFITDTASTAGSSLAEQPVMTGISRLASGDRYGGSPGIVGGIMSSIASAPSSFVPTLFSQVAATVDPVKKNIPKDFSGRMLTLVANKIPFATNLLNERMGTLGENLKKGTGNPVTDAILNLVSPVIYSKLSDNPNAQLISQLYSETGDTGVLPRKTDKVLRYKGEIYELNQEQQSQLQQKTAELALDRLTILTRGIDFNKISQPRKVKIMEKIYNYAGKSAREEMLKMMKRKKFLELLNRE